MSPPTAQLLDVLAHHRRAGTRFADAWPTSVLNVVAKVQDVDEAIAWRRVFAQTAAACEASYNAAPPTQQERHLSLLADATDQALHAT